MYSRSVVKCHEEAQAFTVVDYERGMTAKTLHKYVEYGLLFKIYIGFLGTHIEQSVLEFRAVIFALSVPQIETFVQTTTKPLSLTRTAGVLYFSVWMYEQKTLNSHCQTIQTYLLCTDMSSVVFQALG